MKKIVLLLFLTMGVKSVFAECAMSGMEFFPKQKEISLNSMFIIQGYAMSEKTIVTFKDRLIYLESENGDLIKLDLQEILIGQMSLTQAVFKPSVELKPNTIYFLKYADQTKRETREMAVYNREKEKNEKIYWKTTSKKFIGPLDFKLKISYEKSEVVHYGCGPSVNAIFKIKDTSKSEVWYKTEVVDLTTNQKTSFYEMESKGKLHVGHGMCAGGFTFNGKGKYKVRFTPMNADGETLKTTGWKTFDSPYVNDKMSFGF
ncbi:hypothetical protein [Aureibaculum conchae]|uniref:hypothetical protein n=1 Tax=Aureibaculum sp. 2308TA14-22 TaxID=3108392 RepID=UPI0033973673